MEKTVILEKNRRFSESALWRYQQEFFDQRGIEAWSQLVPFYITSNPFIGNSYAQVMIRYLQDLTRQNSLDLEQPIYIIELGTGPGRFSFYCLKRLLELRTQLDLEQLKLCYVMTDFTQSNVSYWQEHPALAAYAEQGVLDFAVFNLETDKEITLIKNNVTLSAGTVTNPILAVGNYIFDTITSDIFRFENGQGYDVMSSLETPIDNTKDKQPISLDKITTKFHQQAINLEKRYQDNALNDVLIDYAKTLNNTSVIFPIGGFKTLQTLGSWSNNRLMLISTDKGYNSTEELSNLNNPKVIFHGSFSMMVNFHAMGEYMKKIGGDCFQQTIRKSIKTSVFISDGSFEELPETKLAIDTYVEQFSPGDFFNMHEHLKATKEKADIKRIVSHLRLSLWDPHIFGIFADRISQTIAEVDLTQASSVIAGIPHLLSNIYLMPNAHDTYFDIGLIFHTLNDYRSALIYYKQSLAHFGEKFTTLFNLGLCYYATNALETALEHFELSLKVSPDSERAIEWIETVKKEL